MRYSLGYRLGGWPRDLFCQRMEGGVSGVNGLTNISSEGSLSWLYSVL